jgi:hypothetical protein
MDRQAKTTGPSSFNTGHKNISVKNFTPFWARFTLTALQWNFKIACTWIFKIVN